LKKRQASSYENQTVSFSRSQHTQKEDGGHINFEEKTKGYDSISS
jgi:hypothetical protein